MFQSKTINNHDIFPHFRKKHMFDYSPFLINLSQPGFLIRGWQLHIKPLLVIHSRRLNDDYSPFQLSTHFMPILMVIQVSLLVMSHHFNLLLRLFKGSPKQGWCLKPIHQWNHHVISSWSPIRPHFLAGGWCLLINVGLSCWQRSDNFWFRSPVKQSPISSSTLLWTMVYTTNIPYQPVTMIMKTS